MLKNIIFILFAYVSSYFIHIYLEHILFDNAMPSYIFEGYPIILLAILIFGLGFYNFKKKYSFLLLTFIIILIIGLIEYNFFIEYMDSCLLSGLSDFSCAHDCDGPCAGWFTFENEKSWLFLSYITIWFFFSSIFFLIKFIFYNGAFEIATFTDTNKIIQQQNKK